ncbi:MAG: flagellar basal-body rod protein FlgC [Actinomycetota bacterium]|nr:flagellar basal-body rod protein FlgC [Actinomycetota bacterium]
MSIFPAIGISASGIDAAQSWIDTSAGNLANMNDAVPLGNAAYQQQTPVFSAVGRVTGPGAGVAVSSVQLGSPAGVVVSDPSSPLANAQGLVREPAISTASQLVALVEAQNYYQANASAYDRAVVAYQSALTLGS